MNDGLGNPAEQTDSEWLDAVEAEWKAVCPGDWIPPHLLHVPRLIALARKGLGLETANITWQRMYREMRDALYTALDERDELKARVKELEREMR